MTELPLRQGEKIFSISMSAEREGGLGSPGKWVFFDSVREMSVGSNRFNTEFASSLRAGMVAKNVLSVNSRDLLFTGKRGENT